MDNPLTDNPLTDNPLTDEVLRQLRELSINGDPPPWTSYVEGRDGTSFDSFIMVDGGDEPDIYLSVYEKDRRRYLVLRRDDGVSPTDLNLDLIAASRTYLPLLIDEVERLRKSVRSLEENQRPE
jgi:hypothetical protein